jgi:LysR family nitrogen assimilation transcriptional regulator
MDLKQLEYFVAVVDLGGFSRASRLLGVAQPAISRQVRGLEVELHQNLLLRNGRGAVPTEAGKRLLDHARSILQQVERARREVDEVKGAPVGHVAIGLPPTLALVLTAPIVREFRRRYPKATVSIVEGLSVNILEWVVVGRADVGVLYNPVRTPAVELLPLLEEELCLIGPRSPRRTTAAVRLRELPEYPLIIPSRPHAIRTLVEDRLATLGLRPQVALEIDAIGAILELVAERQGYAVLSPRAVQSAEVGRKLVARPIVQPPLRSSLAMAVSAQRPARPIQTAAAELVREMLERRPAPRRPVPSAA